MLSTSLKSCCQSNFILSKQDILDFEAEHGQIAEGLLLPSVVIGRNVGQIKMLCAILMKMGFNKVQDGAIEALEFLIHERHVKAVVMRTF